MRPFHSFDYRRAWIVGLFGAFAICSLGVLLIAQSTKAELSGVIRDPAGLGVEGNGAHARHEHILRSALAPRVALLALLVESL